MAQLEAPSVGKTAVTDAWAGGPQGTDAAPKADALLDGRGRRGHGARGRASEPRGAGRPLHRRHGGWVGRRTTLARSEGSRSFGNAQWRFAAVQRVLPKCKVATYGMDVPGACFDFNDPLQ